MTKNNLRITAKHHAHLQTLTKTPAKLKKDRAKTIGGVAFARVCQMDGRTDRRTHGERHVIIYKLMKYRKILIKYNEYFFLKNVFYSRED